MVGRWLVRVRYSRDGQRAVCSALRANQRTKLEENSGRRWIEYLQGGGDFYTVVWRSSFGISGCLTLLQLQVSTKHQHSSYAYSPLSRLKKPHVYNVFPT
ncbi:hypothetical protein B0O99DRAFT_616405 [Bisporella sp. PMI_857]|nr:hypothetical protein B0O99DRAFT_616405 [Bisporella sp. PMI_857]